MDSGELAAPSIHLPDANQIFAGRYRIEARIGGGGMGMVYRAVDETLGETVAIKVLNPLFIANETVRERLRNELRIARKLQHPHLVRMYTFDESEQGIPFVVMQFVAGVSLEELLNYQPKRKLPFDEAIRILSQIASALAHAHEKGVIHRDLKPQNVLIAAEGAIKLGDFGLAHSDLDDEHLTRTGAAVGTPFYMSPEQFRGETATTAADVYSYGILAFEMLTGRRPFDAQVYFSLALQHISDPFPEINDPNVPSWCKDLVRGCARKNPLERFSSMEEVRQVIIPHVSQWDDRKWYVLWRNGGRKRKWRARFKQVKKYLRRLRSVMLFLLLFHLIFAAGSHLNGWTGRAMPTAILFLDKYCPPFVFAPMKFLLGCSDVDARRSEQILEKSCDQNSQDYDPEKARLLALIVDNPNVRYPGGDSALHCALKNARILVMILLDRGVDVNVRGEEGLTPLQIAVGTNDLDDVFRLLRQSRLDIVDDLGNNVFHTAVMSMTPSALRLVLDRHPPVNLLNARNNEGDTPILAAVRSARLRAKDLLEMLIVAGANPALPDKQGLSPLMSAASRGRSDVVAVLLQYSSVSDVNAVDDNKRTALMHTVLGPGENSSRADVVRLLLDAGADMNAQDASGQTALDGTKARGKNDPVKKLLENALPRKAVERTSAFAEGRIS